MILALNDAGGHRSFTSQKDSLMRSVFFAAILLPAAASVAHSQQAQPTSLTVHAQQTLVAHPTPAPSLRPVDAPIGITRAQARPNAVGSNQLANGTTPAVDNNTRNTLAIVGAVVIVLALVAFLL